MPVVSTIWDYAEHHTQLSEDKYYLAIVSGNESENETVKLTITNASLSLKSGVIDLSSYLEQSYIVDLGERRFQRIYIAKNGVSTNFLETSPMLRQVGKRVTKATQYYSDEHGFLIAQEHAKATLNLRFTLSIDGVAEVKELEIPMSFEKKSIVRNAIR